MIAVNASLIFAAVDTFTGVTTDTAYDRGRAYNAVIAEGRGRMRWAGSPRLAG